MIWQAVHFLLYRKCNCIYLIFQLHAAAQIYAEAMKTGYVERNFIKCLIIGAAGVGKTAIRHLLLSKKPPAPEQRKSTPLMENPIRAITFSRAREIGCKEDNMWSIVNDDEQLMEIIAEHLKTLQEETKTNDATMSTGNQSSLSTLNLKDAREDGALLESSHIQNNPSDCNLTSTENVFHGEYTMKQEEPEMCNQNVTLLSHRESIKSDGVEVEITNNENTTPKYNYDIGILSKSMQPLEQPILNNNRENSNPSHSHDKESTYDPLYHKFVESFSEAKGMYLCIFTATCITIIIYKGAVN